MGVPFDPVAVVYPALSCCPARADASKTWRTLFEMISAMLGHHVCHMVIISNRVAVTATEERRLIDRGGIR